MNAINNIKIVSFFLAGALAISTQAFSFAATIDELGRTSAHPISSNLIYLDKDAKITLNGSTFDQIVTSHSDVYIAGVGAQTLAVLYCLAPETNVYSMTSGVLTISDALLGPEARKINFFTTNMLTAGVIVNNQILQTTKNRDSITVAALDVHNITKNRGGITYTLSASVGY